MVTEEELQDLMTTGLKTYFHDPFLSSEHITSAVTQTGYVYKNLAQLKVETGVQEASEARANYDREFFNPLYSILRFKMRLNSMADTFMFAGFKSTLAAPTWHMTETHAGIMLYDGTCYFVTGNGDPGSPFYQVTPIADIDMTRWLIYEIEGHTFRWYSLPYTVPYFDKNVLPGIKQGIIRKWSGLYTNGSVLPDDTMHYLVFYIKNNVGQNKYLELQHATFSEVYPD